MIQCLTASLPQGHIAGSANSVSNQFKILLRAFQRFSNYKTNEEQWDNQNDKWLHYWFETETKHMQLCMLMMIRGCWEQITGLISQHSAYTGSFQFLHEEISRRATLYQFPVPLIMFKSNFLTSDVIISVVIYPKMSMNLHCNVKIIRLLPIFLYWDWSLEYLGVAADLLDLPLALHEGAQQGVHHLLLLALAAALVHQAQALGGSILQYSIEG